MALEPAFVELLVVEGTEIKRQSAEGADRHKRSREKVDHDAKFGLPRELQSLLCLNLGLVKRSSAAEQNGDRATRAIRGKGEVPGLLRNIERTTREGLARPYVLGPRIDQKRKDGRHTGLVSAESGFLNQVKRKLAEAKSRGGVAKIRTKDPREHGVREAGRRAVPVFQAQIHHATQ